MKVDPRAGQPPAASMLVNVPRLITAYYTQRPDLSVPGQRVSFGTSGHRGSALDTSFNEPHILAITQAICEYRLVQGITGPLFLGADTHALSESAWASALEVLAANDVNVLIDDRHGYTPTPVVSHAILTYNRARRSDPADGIVITPSHNPPRDGGFKYNPPNGGPADTQITGWIQDRANTLLADDLLGVKRMPFDRARSAASTRDYDFMDSYIGDLSNVVDLDALRSADLRLAVDPMGGAGVQYWGMIAERYRVPITVVSDEVDPTFRFMTVDWDGKIRMDCSSPYAMQRLVHLKDRFDVAWACDPDHDRHGIVTRKAGLLNPNHYLAAAIGYLFTHRPEWPAEAGVGKTVVSTSMIDRVAAQLRRPLMEVPVGFKWFVDGLINGTLGFGGEESAGASLLRRDGTVWTTDKDGIVLGLLAAEMTAVTGRDPGDIYHDLTEELGDFAYERIDAPATPEQKAALQRLSPDQVTASTLAGDRITSLLTKAPGNGAPIGGLKVVTEKGWFAARPSGTEEVYKLYAESYVGSDHLKRIQEEAQAIIGKALGGR
ncbi:MAG: phosphoglucomutase (alpha-D-glucose-1,6-bisphosphate-dependent) [Gemmatimonadales bacterium]